MATRSLLVLVTARSVRILLECFLVLVINIKTKLCKKGQKLANKTHGFEIYRYIIYQTDECLYIKSYYRYR